MRNRITRYELILTDGSHRRYLVGYTPRLGRSGLLDCMQGVGTDIMRLTEMTDDVTVSWPKGARACDFSHGWTVRFSGRTQIDAQNAGELPFIDVEQRSEAWFQARAGRLTASRAADMLKLNIQ